MPTQWHIQLFGALQARHGDQVITRFRTAKGERGIGCRNLH
jgi:hypothetical protein